MFSATLNVADYLNIGAIPASEYFIEVPQPPPTATLERTTVVLKYSIQHNALLLLEAPACLEAYQLVS